MEKYMENAEAFETNINEREEIRGRLEKFRTDLDQKLEIVSTEISEGKSSPTLLELRRLGNKMLELYDLFPQIEIGSAGSFAWESDLGHMTRQFEDLWMLRDVSTKGFIIHDHSFERN